MERVMAALSRREPDRVPVIVGGYAFEVKLAGYTFPECLADADKYVDSIVRSLYEFGRDAVKGPQVSYAIPEALGSGVRIFEDEVPAVAEPFLKTQPDLSRLPDLQVVKAGRLPFLLEVTRKVRARVGPEVPLVGHSSLPFRVACMLRGMQNLYRDMIANPSFVKALSDYLVDVAVDVGLAGLEAGADMVFLTNPVANASCISRKHYQEFVHPYTRETIARLKAKGAKIMVHYCGDWSDRMDLVCEEGPHILHIDSVPNMNLGAMKAQYGDKMCLMGNVRTVETLLLGSAEDVERESRDCITQAGANGGFILSGNCSLPRDIPPANLHALVRAAKAYGTYPLIKLG